MSFTLKQIFIGVVASVVSAWIVWRLTQPKTGTGISPTTSENPNGPTMGTRLGDSFWDQYLSPNSTDPSKIPQPLSAVGDLTR